MRLFLTAGFKSAISNIDMKVFNTWDNRRVGLTFTYRFSKGQAVQQRKQSGSSQDEQRRIGGGN